MKKEKEKTNLSEFGRMCSVFLNSCLSLMLRKNKDYARRGDAFKNLTVHAKIIKLLELDYGNRLHQPLGHIIEKVHRLANLTGREPKNESIDDSIKDIIVFACLYRGMWLEDRKNEPSSRNR